MEMLLLIGFPLVATFLSLAFTLSFLASTLLFFGIPSLYMSWRRPKLIRKSLLFALLFATPMIFIFDHMAYLDFTWFVPNSAWRFLQNSIPVEDAVWAYLWVYFAVVFWEYFLDHDKNKLKIDRRIRYLVVIVAVLLTGFFGLYLGKSTFLNQPYFYLKMGLIFIVVPILIVLINFPKLARKIILLGVYFLMVSFLAEYVGLKNYQWYFGGKNYLGTTRLTGYVLPYDEILFWWALGVPGVICWYEFFVDDRK